ncbi:MAG: hypothetical protein CSA81_13030 [Acidobacteria bacterium]|nr:MAG: hypothetical protein CSA81_13030 [Acidobacteriota bacterium]PIE89142.1 MAG: hypothetical protein CR997_12770 [Acidobacteriota bacterium]
MKNKSYDGSFDLSEAISLAKKLHHRFVKSNYTFSGKYTQSQSYFSSSDFSTPAEGDTQEIPVEVHSQELPEVPEIHFDGKNMHREQAWNFLLEWAKDESQSRWAFICDDQGLIIAETAEKPDINPDEMISNITNGIHNLSRFGEKIPIEILAYKKGEHWISVFTCPLSSIGADITVGLLSKKETSLLLLNHIQEGFKTRLQEL